MGVLALIDKLENQIRNAKPVPLTDQVRIDKQVAHETLDQMRATIAGEAAGVRGAVARTRLADLPELVDELADTIHNARPVPLTDYVRIDQDRCQALLDRMRATIPPAR